MPARRWEGAAAELIGRRRELDEFDEVLELATNGRGELVLVAGSAGLGKTTLVEEVSTRAQKRGFEVAWATCWEPAASVAFRPWTQLLGALANSPDDLKGTTGARITLARGAAGVRPEDASSVRTEVFDAVASSLRAAAVERPHLLVIDDLHAADTASVELLTFLAPTLRLVAAVVVAAYRIDDVDPSQTLGRRLPELLRCGRQLVLSGLAQHDVAAMITAITGQVPPEEAAAAITERTGGNPLFVRELVRLLPSPRVGVGGTDPTSTTGVPETVRAVLRHRLAGLSADCQHALTVASVVGQPFTIELMVEITGHDGAQWLAVIGEAVAAQVLRPSGAGRYEFAHALFREAAYEELGEAARTALHERAGEALERFLSQGRRVEPAHLAHHFLAAAGLGNWAKAATYSRDAGERSMASFAYEDAVRHFEAALDCLDHLTGEVHGRGRLLLALAEAAAACGNRTKSKAAAAEAAGVARADRDAELLARAALCLTSDPTGFEVELFDDDHISVLKEALTGLGDGPDVLRALVLARLSVALSMAAPVEERRQLAEEALDLGRATGDAEALAYTLAAHCDAIAGPADVDQRLSEARQIVNAAASCRDRRLQLLGHRLRVVALFEVGDVLGAHATVESYAALAEEVRQPLYGWLVPLWRGAEALMNGRFDDCERWLEDANRLGERAGSANAALMYGLQRWFLLMQSGRASEGLDALHRVVGALPEPATAPRVSLALGLAASGRIDDARAHLGALSVEELTAVPQDSEWLPMLAELSEAIAMVGGHPLGEWTYQVLQPHRRLFAVEGLGAVVLGSIEHHLGLLAHCLQRRDIALAHFEAAKAAHRRMGAALLVARTERAAAALEASSHGSGPQPVEHGENVFRCQGEYWTLAHRGRVAQVGDMKGLHDIARLLGDPGREIHVLDLVARAMPVGRGADARELAPEGSLGEVLDRRARDAYRARLQDLDSDIDEAVELGDQERAARARAEREALVDELASAYGIGGRPRRSGDPAERARSTLTRRIRDALRRVEGAHPELGAHLRRSIRTGTFCVYEPDRPINWTT